MHPVNQFQQILQLQHLRQQQQALQQQQQQQQNRQQIQIFASPPNTNHVTQLPNNSVSVSNPSANPTLFQIQPSANNRNTLSNTNASDVASTNVHNVSNGIQLQPLQILQMTQNNAAANNAQQQAARNTVNNTAHNQNNHRQQNSAQQAVNARPISVTATATPLSSINLSSIPQLGQIALFQRIQQRARAQHAAHQAQAMQQQQQQQQQHQQQQQQQQQHNNVTNNGHNNGNAQFRQSIQQQMVAFIQQLQQFPPLFQHLQSNPQVLAQLLQQFKCKQEQNARDMQQRQQLQPQQANIGNLQTFNNVNLPIANTQHIGALLRNIHSAQRQQAAVAVQQAAAAAAAAQNNAANIGNNMNIQAPNTSNNNNNNANNTTQGMLPALENENSLNNNNNGSSLSGRNRNGLINNNNNNNNNNTVNSNASQSINDDLVILNDTKEAAADIQSIQSNNNNSSTNSTSNNLNMNTMNANANNSKHNNNVTNVNIAAISSNMPDINNNANGSNVADNNGAPKLDFSQLKKMTIPIVEGEKSQNSTSSTLKRPFSTMEQNIKGENVKNESLAVPPSKRRRLNSNNDSYPDSNNPKNPKTITLSSDENDTNHIRNSDNYSNYNNIKRGSAARMPRAKKKKRRKNKKSNNSKQDEVVSLVSDADAPSFKDIVDRAKNDGDQDVIGDEDSFVNDPLISQIATKMFEIRQINNNRRVATPEATGKISKGLDVLLQAIDEMSDDKQQTKKMNVDNKETTKHKSLRKNGELFVIDHSNRKENVSGGYSVHKIKSILETNYDYDNFFKLNENATFLANANDIELERSLKELAQQFTHHYNNGLLEVFKTCTHPIYKEKFSQCIDTNYTSILKYYSIWNEIFNQHILCQMNVFLKNHSIKNAVGLIFALMDHIFSYSMYRYLCGNSYHCIPIKQKSAKEKKLESEKYIQLSGNLLFSQFESDKERISSIADMHIFWLFEYWKKVLLQSQEPVKCLCRSYLANSAPNPYKNRFYVMVTQTLHAPHTVVVPSKARIRSKSASPAITIKKQKENKYYRHKAKTPPNTMGHFIRRNSGTMSINGIIKSSVEKNSSNNNNNNIPSSSVCGKTFMNATQCAQHTKDCKECNHRIVTIQSNV